MDFLMATGKAELNQALFQVTHGLYILTAKDETRANGQCLDALMQVTNSPARVAIAVNKRSLTGEMIAKTGRFVVNVLDRENRACPDVIKHFGFQSGHDVDKFKDYPHEKDEHGIPILPDAKAFYACRVESDMTLDLGTHTLYIAEVEQAGTHESGEPLTYNEYRKTIRRRR
jgi:flavin reductase (DIM6/NTAB) family NADH-FMN oxidoreductase RutF